MSTAAQMVSRAHARRTLRVAPALALDLRLRTLEDCPHRRTLEAAHAAADAGRLPLKDAGAQFGVLC